MNNENKKMQVLDDEALENVSGGAVSSGTVVNNSYLVTAAGGALVFKDSDMSSSSVGRFEAGWVIFVSGSEFVGKDNGKWLKVSAQRNVSGGYIRRSDVEPQNISMLGAQT